jgi:hypothetical protein
MLNGDVSESDSDDGDNFSNEGIYHAGGHEDDGLSNDGGYHDDGDQGDDADDANNYDDVDEGDDFLDDGEDDDVGNEAHVCNGECGWCGYDPDEMEL